MRRQGYMIGAALLLMLALGSCGNGGEDQKPDGLQPITMDFDSTEAPSSMDDPQERVSKEGTTEGTDHVSASAAADRTAGSMEAYKAVLRGEGEFLDAVGGESMKLDQVRQAITPDEGVTITPDFFAVVDLDGDKEAEVVLSLRLNGGSFYGSLVLRCQEGVVYGYVFSDREFGQVRTDGTFLASGGAADVGLCKAAFDKEKVLVDKFTYCESGYDSENNLIIAYFVDHMAAEKGDFDLAYTKWETVPEVQWYALTDNNIDSLSPSLSESGATAVRPGSGGQPDFALPGQIMEQSFEVSLDGWGEVTFAAFEPEEMTVRDADGYVAYGDVVFKLLKNGEAVYSFPGYNEENIRYSQQFGQVSAVAFRDYDGDGREDILTIIEYAGVQGSEIDVPFREARAYTQADGETVFMLDGALSEYLDYYTDSMSEIYKGLESYEANYNVATSKTAWEVERFAREVQQQILGGDFEGLCMNISFPITVDDVVYQDSEAFLKADFINNPNPEFLEELRLESCENMFVSYQGIMMGNGIIWIGETVKAEDLSSIGLKVIKINGLTAR